jgi:hypothetical protein
MCISIWAASFRLGVLIATDPLKILRLIGECPLGLHDISRTGLDATTGLPRFNMPLELGLFLGAQHFGDADQQGNACLVLDREPQRYVKFISDIKGVDIESYADDPAQAIAAVRDWLDTRSTDILLDGTVIADRFSVFAAELPGICAAARLKADRLTFKNYVQLVQRWLKLNAQPVTACVRSMSIRCGGDPAVTFRH